jgi:hypothetical protein
MSFELEIVPTKDRVITTKGMVALHGDDLGVWIGYWALHSIPLATGVHMGRPEWILSAGDCMFVLIRFVAIIPTFDPGCSI